MTDAVDLTRHGRLAFALVEAHVRVLACQEQVNLAYPHVGNANAALSEAQAHLVEVQRRYDQLLPFAASYETTAARSHAR